MNLRILNLELRRIFPQQGISKFDKHSVIKTNGDDVLA